MSTLLYAIQLASYGITIVSASISIGRFARSLRGAAGALTKPCWPREARDAAQVSGR
jgi:hypothetical protein